MPLKANLRRDYRAAMEHGTKLENLPEACLPLRRLNGEGLREVENTTNARSVRVPLSMAQVTIAISPM